MFTWSFAGAIVGNFINGRSQVRILLAVVVGAISKPAYPRVNEVAVSEISRIARRTWPSRKNLRHAAARVVAR
jgi:hypothetical protein